LGATRLCVDTSVFGGCFDPEFDQASRQLFEEVRQGKHLLLVSETTAAELVRSPDPVRELVEGLAPECVERVVIAEEMVALQEAYLAAGVVGEKWRDDALHVAAATVARAEVLVSWNFRHLVNLHKARS
jgi:predicted nucleic acid-binding protein